MKRFKFALCVASLLGLAAITNQTSAQSDFKISEVEAVELPGSNDFATQVTRDSDEIRRPANVDVQDPPNVYKMASPLQDVPGPQVLRLSVPTKPGHRAKTVTRYIHEQLLVPIPAEELEEAKDFEAAVKELKDAKNDDDKAKATTTIQQLLEKQFQRDLKRREEELAPIEERVKSLRQQLDKRKSSMSEIISLRFKTIVNNAEGLGFPDDDGLFGTPASTSVQRKAPSRRNLSPPDDRQNVSLPDEKVDQPVSKRDRPVKPRSSSKSKVTKPFASDDVVEPLESR
jgi:hypothetical protein